MGSSDEVSVRDAVRLQRAADLGVAPSKVLVPWMRPGLVVRRRLVDRLEAAGEPLVMAVAPAGYGKTTVLGQWAASTTRRVAWVSLDERDNIPSALLRAVAVALDGHPGSDELLRQLARPRVSPGVQLARLSGFVSAIEEPFLLVLDHFEVLSSGESLDVVTELATVMPPRSRLAVATRSVRESLLARGRAEGRLHELGPDLLRLDLDEARALFEACGVDVDDEHLAEVLIRTEGWPTGVYLTALAVGTDPTGRGDHEVSGNDRFVADYLHAELLDRLEPDLRSFLVRTSFLERLSAPLCDAVLDDQRSAERLARLERSNLLVVPLDRTREWYRYHHLLRDLLRAELAATHTPEELGELERRAALWFEADGHPEVAMAHAQAAGDDVLAAGLFVRHGIRQYQVGRPGVVLAWTKWFDERKVLTDHPVVPVLGAVVEALTGNAAAAERLAGLMDDTRADATLPSGVTLRGWVAAVRSGMGLQGPVRALEDARVAMDELALGAPMRAPASLYGGMAQLVLGDLDDADRLFVLCVETANPGETPSAVAALAGRAMAAICRRDWRSAAAFSATSLELLGTTDIGDYLGSVGTFAVASRVASHRGDMKEASAFAARAQRLRPMCSRAFLGSAPLLLQLAYAHVELADPAGARSVLRQLRDIQLAVPDLGIVGEQADELQATLSSMGTGVIGVTALTTSELRLLPFLATHLTLRDIADRLYLSRHTVKTHALSIYRKVGASSRAEAVERLAAAGLLDGTLPSG